MEFEGFFVGDKAFAEASYWRGSICFVIFLFTRNSWTLMDWKLVGLIITIIFLEVFL